MYLASADFALHGSEAEELTAEDFEDEDLIQTEDFPPGSGAERQPFRQRALFRGGVTSTERRRKTKSRPIRRRNRQQRRRDGRQRGGQDSGIDFSGCQNDPDTGLCCIEKEDVVTSIQKDPILECTHKNVEKCHYTYVTQFEAAQEEVCDENFEKTCQVSK